MINSDSKSGNKLKNTGNPPFSGARKIGYIVVIIIMFVLIYALGHLREWGLTFLTEDFDRCLIYIKLSIYVTIAAHVLFILYDNRWFKHIIQAMTGIASAVAVIMVYVIFPFDIENGNWDKWLKIGLLVIFGLTVIGIIVDLVKGIRYLLKDPEAV